MFLQDDEKGRRRRSRIVQILNESNRFSEIGISGGFFRSPRSIEWANGPTKCGRYLLRSSLAAALPGERRVSARWGWAGVKSGLF